MTTKYTEIDSDPYLTFRADQLVVGALLPFDVFIREQSLMQPLFYAGTLFTGFAKNVLKEKGISEVYVRNVDQELVDLYIARRKAEAEAPPDEQTIKAYSAEKEQHFVIDKTLLSPGTGVPFPLFVQDGISIALLAEASEKAPFVIQASMLPEQGNVLIKKVDIPRYRAYLNSLVSGGAAAGKEQQRIRTVAIRENSKLLLKELLEEPRSGEKIKESITLVHGMVDSILDNRDALKDLLSLSTYDYYTYTHSVNVAVLSVGLAIAVGLPRERTEKLGIGAMLHDMGKSVIPHEILNKPGKLDQGEYEKMKTHVAEGEQLLRIHREIPAEAFDAVTQHHERMSGTGYPNRKAGDQITLFGRLTSIVDCYDALTTRRPYQPARTPFYALSILTQETNDYDAEMLKVFIRMLGEVKT